MSDAETSPFPSLTATRDVDSLRKVILAGEFVLISVSSGEDGDDDDDGYGALTAEIDGFEALVVFSSETLAGEFVNGQEDLFEDGEEVEGIVVEGDALLEYLPDGFGMLVDPEFDDASVIDPPLAKSILGELSTEASSQSEASGQASADGESDHSADSSDDSAQ